MLSQLSQYCKANGVRAGESAKDIAKRDPQAAIRIAKFISQNHASLTKSIAEKLA
jgi:hypothetical protein